jgi:hypothetical protein
MVPLFAPSPIEHPRIPVELAAVNPYMCQVAGEAADGIRAHPVVRHPILHGCTVDTREASFSFDNTPSYPLLFI